MAGCCVVAVVGAGATTAKSAPSEAAAAVTACGSDVWSSDGFCYKDEIKVYGEYMRTYKICALFVLHSV